jgi:hypothetical protein
MFQLFCLLANQDYLSPVAETCVLYFHDCCNSFCKNWHDLCMNKNITQRNPTSSYIHCLRSVTLYNAAKYKHCIKHCVIVIFNNLMVLIFVAEPVANSNSGYWLSHIPRDISAASFKSEEDISCKPVNETDLSLVIQSYEKTIGISFLFASPYMLPLNVVC